MNKQLFEKANEIIKTCSNASFGVIDEAGFPSVSAISLVNPQDITELYFATSIDANKAKRIKSNNKASICYYNSDDDALANITLVGEAEICTDQETKSKYWLNWFIHMYPEGETDPNYCIVKFKTKRASLYINHESAELAI